MCASIYALRFQVVFRRCGAFPRPGVRAEPLKRELPGTSPHRPLLPKSQPLAKLDSNEAKHGLWCGKPAQCESYSPNHSRKSLGILGLCTPGSLWG